MPGYMDAPPPVFSPSTAGPVPPSGPSMTESFGQMTGGMPQGESAGQLIIAASEILVRASQASQREGRMHWPITLAECVTKLTEMTTEDSAMLAGQAGPMRGGPPPGGGIPSLQSPQTALPMGPLSRPAMV